MHLYQQHQLGNPRWPVSSSLLPVYPLIVGGDDLFCLVPARWALHQAFCCAHTFQQEMQNGMRTLGERLAGKTPTLTVAVVLCKASYPFSLAHRAAENLLRQAKTLSKQLKASQPACSACAIDFQVLRGNVGDDDADAPTFRPGIGPYWTGPVPSQYGVSLETLLNQRLALNPIPSAQLQQLRALFHDLPDRPTAEDISAWNQALARWLKRLQRPGGAGGSQTIVEQALVELGAPLGTANLQYWRSCDRGSRGVFLGHGFPELSEVWDFAHRLDRPAADYERKDD